MVWFDGFSGGVGCCWDLWLAGLLLGLVAGLLLLWADCYGGLWVGR